jgi:hypothetical protein
MDEVIRVAEIVPHPSWRARLIEEGHRQADEIQSYYRRRQMYLARIGEHRDRLVALGVAPSVIEAEVAAMVKGFGLQNTSKNDSNLKVIA